MLICFTNFYLATRKTYIYLQCMNTEADIVYYNSESRHTLREINQ